MLTGERAVPLRKLPLIRRVIVLPDKEQEENKAGGGNQNEERQWSRRHS